MSEVHRTWAMGACLLGLFLAGCEVDQDKEVAEYRKVLDKGIQRPTTAPVSDGTLTLQQALHLANQNDESLASQGETYLQAIIAKNQAAGAFLPTVDGSAQYSLADNGNGGTSDQTTATVTGSLNVFNGFQDIANLRKAGFTIEQERELLLNQQATLLLNVVQTYYQILKSEQEIEVYRRSIAYQEEKVRDTEARVRLGIAKPLDLAQSRSDLAGTRVSLTQSMTDARNGRTTLAYLIGVPQVTQTLADDLTIPAEPETLETFLRVAVEHRRDLIAARRAVQAAEQNVKAKFGQYYPSVSVDMSYLLYHEPSEGGLWTGAVSANVPIFSAGRIEAEVRTAWSQCRQAGLAEANLRRQVEEEVRKAFENLGSSGRKLQDLNDEVAAAQNALALAERSYQLGNATNLDRLSALDTLTSAKLQQTREQLNEKAFYLELLRRAGQLSLALPASETTLPATRPTK